MSKELNEMAAQLMVAKSSIWYLGSALRDAMNRLVTVGEQDKSISVESDIARARKVLEDHAKGCLSYCPPPPWENPITDETSHLKAIDDLATMIGEYEKMKYPLTQ